ncbi:MAG TPA: Uma2 family endonuclease [Saprospiraceae bacterium]|nr:Uma2 family endonuclease [Saprospiraceae bacterium]HMP25060.1 Uma2 family endonuclease [Saprospiraceae bacterium]
MNPVVEEISPYELERGKPMPSLAHAIVQSNLVRHLGNRYEANYRFLSELSLELEGWKSVPDIAIFNTFDMDFRHDEVRSTQPPLGVIEILSATQGIMELSDKANQYFANGVRSCWVVIPPFKTVYVFSAADQYATFTAEDMLKDTVLGIELPLSEVFR